MTSSYRSDGGESDSQSNLLFDDGPRRFREGHPDDRFTGSSGMLFEQAMAQTRMAICLTDPHLPDNPIVFANRAFLALTGYPETEVTGRNCRFLQGPDTDPEAIRRLSEAIAGEDVVIVEMINYRKDGTRFWNALHVGPIYDDAGRLVYYFGSQWDVSDLHVARSREQHATLVARELSHRMKNMFSVIAAIVNVTGRVRGIEAETAEITARIHALGRAYETTLDDAATGTSLLGHAVAATLAPYDDRIAMEGPDIKVPFGVISAIGLILHELAANAGKYGAWADGAGRVEVAWRETGAGEIALRWQERGGPPVAETDPRPGTGMTIIDRLLRASGGRMERRWNHDGLEAIVTMPVAG